MFQTWDMASTFLCALLALFLAIQSVSADPLGSLLAPIFSPILGLFHFTLLISSSVFFLFWVLLLHLFIYLLGFLWFSWIFWGCWFLITDDVCKQVECGKGTCKPSSNSTLLFECECEPGWKQTSSNHTDHFKFLPCVIPQCKASIFQSPKWAFK